MNQPDEGTQKQTPSAEELARALDTLILYIANQVETDSLHTGDTQSVHTGHPTSVHTGHTTTVTLTLSSG